MVDYYPFDGTQVGSDGADAGVAEAGVPFSTWPAKPAEEVRRSVDHWTSYQRRLRARSTV